MRQRGFVNTELRIVVAVVGVLSAIAIPAYVDYWTRSRIGDGVALTISAREAVRKSFESRGPADMSRPWAWPARGR